MSHDHCHTHDIDISTSVANRKRLLITLILMAVYMVAEIVGGLLSNSLALLADAGHMLSDVAALGLSFFAIWISQRPAAFQRTYGYYRTEILAALVNGVALVVISIFIFIEAYKRFSDPPEVIGPLMMSIAVGGLIVNIIGLFILNAGKSDSLNIRGAWLHVFTDALGSVGAIISGGLIWAFGWYLADPIASVVIGLLVLYSSWALIKEAVRVLMEVAPPHIDVDSIRMEIKKISGVCEVHDLHVWTITSGKESLSCHVVVKSNTNEPSLLECVHEVLHDKFDLNHVTIQIEPENFSEHECPY